MAQATCSSEAHIADRKIGKRDALCSSCGLCSVKAWPAKESIQSCVFRVGWLGSLEAELFGRERNPNSFEESRFGISKKRFVAQLKNPIPHAQWSGIITRICTKALESEFVEGVVVVQNSEDDIFVPVPVLATDKEDIFKAKGNKPTLAPALLSLGEAYQKKLKRLLVVGAPCHVHILRDFVKRSPYLRDAEIYVLGIPCTDNVKPQKLRWILERVSKSHKTLVHYEFMQDFQVHLRHENGQVEKVPYFSLPQELSELGVFAPSCMSCFDYVNSLADLTVGYLGAPFIPTEKRQWLLVRTDKGEELLKFVEDELEIFPEETSGDAREAVKMNAERTIEQLKLGDKAPAKTGRRIPIWVGKLITYMMSKKGPKGLEFARYSIDFHILRNYYYVKLFHPEKLEKIVPKHIYKVLEEYGIEK